MVTATAVVKNGAGIHVRPSGKICDAVRGYDGEVHVRHGDMDTDLKSVIGLIALGLPHGSSVEIEVSGPDEKTKLAEMVELFERVYDFPPRE